MLKAHEIKKLFRSRSLDFVINSRRGAHSDNLKFYNWKGHKVHYRAGTSDAGAINDILIRPSVILRPNKCLFKNKKLEYWIPQEVNPGVILDIGGNIGVTTVYYSYMFPSARIYTFEPVKSNFEVLKNNTSSLDNVSIYNVGLGAEDKIAEIYECEDDTNVAGFSMYDLEVDKTKKQEITIKNIRTYLEELNITNIDLIKIDTEGAEYDILTTMDSDMLANVQWIIGELHGERDFELLAYLSRWFDIDIKKSLRNRLSNFAARNKAYADKIPWRY